MWLYPSLSSIMPPNDGEEESSSLYKSSSDDKDSCSEIQEQEIDGEENEEDANASQVTFDTMGTFDFIDFLMPGGLSLFSVMALRAKTEKLVLKDLPKTIKASGTSKKNFRVTIEALNVGIELLQKPAVLENNNTRHIHDTAKEALKRGAKTLDNITKKMKKLDNDLEKAKAKLSVATEKLQKANSKRDVAECIDKSGNKSEVPKEDQEGTGGREEGIGQCKEGVNTLCIQPGYISLLHISKHTAYLLLEVPLPMHNNRP
jgi:hypothetical protein